MKTLPFLFCFSLSIIASINSVLALPPTEPPLIHDHPFVAIWNAPTDKCQQLHIPLDTAAFQAVTTTGAVPGQFLTIFYEDRLGLYPKVDYAKRKRYRGGVPQNGNLTEHLAKARRQIDHLIFRDSSPGLAVIDWESWRPLWDRNWGSKRIYQKLSITHALQIAPFLASKHISKLAKRQFQQAGRRFMEKTISLGISRPGEHRRRVCSSGSSRGRNVGRNQRLQQRGSLSVSVRVPVPHLQSIHCECDGGCHALQPGLVPGEGPLRQEELQLRPLPAPEPRAFQHPAGWQEVCRDRSPFFR
ncbi:hypothetical protein PAMP_020297 [Pampus punctatissimus]